ncbi:uncharacterized protein LOC144119374 [Amblyomma americanum]
MEDPRGSRIRPITMKRSLKPVRRRLYFVPGECNAARWEADPTCGHADGVVWNKNQDDGHQQAWARQSTQRSGNSQWAFADDAGTSRGAPPLRCVVCRFMNEVSNAYTWLGICSLALFFLWCIG